MGQRRHDLADVTRDSRGGALPLAHGLTAGRTLLSRLRDLGIAPPPVVVVSANAQPEQIAAAVRMAVDAERTSEVEVISVRPSGMR